MYASNARSLYSVAVSNIVDIGLLGVLHDLSIERRPNIKGFRLVYIRSDRMGKAQGTFGELSTLSPPSP
jgi:hypothetical protein